MTLPLRRPYIPRTRALRPSCTVETRGDKKARRPRHPRPGGNPSKSAGNPGAFCLVGQGAGGQGTSDNARGLPMGAAAKPFRTASRSSSLGYWRNNQ